MICSSLARDLTLWWLLVVRWRHCHCGNQRASRQATMLRCPLWHSVRCIHIQTMPRTCTDLPRSVRDPAAAYARGVPATRTAVPVLAPSSTSSARACQVWRARPSQSDTAMWWSVVSMAEDGRSRKRKHSILSTGIRAVRSGVHPSRHLADGTEDECDMVKEEDTNIASDTLRSARRRRLPRRPRSRSSSRVLVIRRRSMSW